MPLLLDLPDQTLADQKRILSRHELSALACTRRLDEAETASANHSFDIGSLPRRARCRQNFRDAQVLHLLSEVIAKDLIAVAEQVPRELGKGKGLP
jgi:hypothetical protein